MYDQQMIPYITYEAEQARTERIVARLVAAVIVCVVFIGRMAMRK